MFPHELSDDLCSLNADRPKLALSAFLQVDPTGKVTGSRFEKTLIQVSRRFSYTEVEAILRGKKDPDTDKIQVMAELAKVLRNKRHEQGGLEFEIPEVRITLDDTGDAIGVSIPVRNEAEMMIEDFMLAANEQAASFLAKKGASIFRIHASPDTAKLTEFVKFANGIGLGLRIPTENTPRAMQLLLDAVRGNPHAGVLSSLLLRTMQKAVYSTDNPGHFGLAFADYTHFTSPIRRYPDLVVHRLLASAIEGKKAYTGKELERIAEQATKMEQNAVDAEREYTRIKGARFLGKKIGQVYEGKVTSVTSWGMFITLLDWGLDGLLHISELRDDYYRLDTWGHTLVGERTGRVYSIGSVIKVKIKSVNAEKGFVDLVLEESPERKNGSGKKHTGKSKNGRTHASAPREGDKKREGAKTTKPATGTGKQEPQSRNEQKKQPSVTGQRTGSGRAHPARKPAAKEVTPGRENQRTDSGRSQAVEKKTTAQTSLNQEKKGWRFWKK
jgi:ribonuclease R